MSYDHEKDTVYIYALSNPETDVVFYVGQTIRPDERYAAHVAALKSIYPHWTQKPGIHLLEEVAYAERLVAEKRWIQAYVAKGYILLNRIHADPIERIRHNTVYDPELLNRVKRICLSLEIKAGHPVPFYVLAEEGLWRMVEKYKYVLKEDEDVP